MNGNRINRSEKKTLTGAERIRKWRKKQNTSKENQSERIKVIRKARNAEMGVDELNRQRAATAERQRISRAERKRKKTDRGAGGEAANVPSYHRRQSLTKAINRSLRALPDSPRKRVAWALFNEFIIEAKFLAHGPSRDFRQFTVEVIHQLIGENRFRSRVHGRPSADHHA